MKEQKDNTCKHKYQRIMSCLVMHYDNPCHCFDNVPLSCMYCGEPEKMQSVSFRWGGDDNKEQDNKEDEFVELAVADFEGADYPCTEKELRELLQLHEAHILKKIAQRVEEAAQHTICGSDVKKAIGHTCGIFYFKDDILDIIKEK